MRAAVLLALLLLAPIVPGGSSAPGDWTTFTHVAPGYQMTLTWGGLGGPLVTGTIDALGARATYRVHAGPVTEGAHAPHRVVAWETLEREGHVVLRLVLGPMTESPVEETSGVLEYTFLDDRILQMSVARAVPLFPASTMVATDLEWNVTFSRASSVTRDGITSGPAAASAEETWGNRARRGVALEHARGTAGMGRVDNGAHTNYGFTGDWRAKRTSLGDTVAHGAYVDAPSIGAVSDSWAVDVLAFLPGGTTADFAALLHAEPEPQPYVPTTLPGAPTYPPVPTPPVPQAVASQDKQAVIALVDTGINPYHVAFRDDSPLARQHPSTYLPGYPADAVAVNLTFDATSLHAALTADAAKWAAMKPDTLYWFPGTKIVGARSSGILPEDPARLTYSTGHGTMTASRAAGNAYSLCPECRIVMVQAGNVLHEDGPQAVRWAADQAWIDVQSHSWSGLVPFQNDVEIPGMRAQATYAAARMPVFASAGNGVSGKAGVLGHPAFTRPTSGAPGVIPVGGHDNGFMTPWTAQYPYVVADACSSWAAVGTTRDGFSPDEAGGTSGSTPYAAGEAARLVLEAKRLLDASGARGADGALVSGAPRPDLGASPLADGALTLDELKSVLFRTAQRRPVFTPDDGVVCRATSLPAETVPVAWRDVPAEVDQYPLIGWGGVSVDTRDLALGVVRGEAPLPVRPADEAAHAQAEGVRDAYRATTGL